MKKINEYEEVIVNTRVPRIMLGENFETVYSVVDWFKKTGRQVFNLAFYTCEVTQDNDKIIVEVY